MKALVIRRFGPPETLCVEDWPMPTIAPEQVLVRVKAAGVNFADCMARMGIYKDAPPKPFIPGYEISGVIEKVGSHVQNLLPGQRVFGLTRFGGCAEYASVDSFQIHEIPDHLSFEEAAAIPVNYFTAYAALCEMARVRENDQVLIHAGAGGVGIAAIQISKFFGARIYATAGSDKKLEFLKSIGVDVAINYLQENYETSIERHLKNSGLDITLNPIGGESLKKDLRLLAPGGRVIAFGLSSASPGDSKNWLNIIKLLASTPIIHPFSLMNGNKGIFGLNMYRYFKGPAHYQKISDGLMALISKGSMRPIIDSSHALRNAPLAHQRFHSRQNIGKVLLNP